MFAKVKPNTRIIGQNIIYFNQVVSTNSFALELLKQNMADDGTIILAEFQGNGRGQSTKTWMSEPFENLLFSIVLKPVTNQIPDSFILNKAICLSMYELIQKLIPNAKVRIKWPNDILVNGRKICGILIENNYTGQVLNWSIVGIGLNVNQIFEHNKELYATSLKSFLGSDINREKLLQDILEHIELRYCEILEGVYKDIEEAFDQHLLGFNQETEFGTKSESFKGYIRGCDRYGRLLIESKEGHIEPYLHGSIKQLYYE